MRCNFPNFSNGRHSIQRPKKDRSSESRRAYNDWTSAGRQWGRKPNLFHNFITMRTTVFREESTPFRAPRCHTVPGVSSTKPSHPCLPHMEAPPALELFLSGTFRNQGLRDVHGKEPQSPAVGCTAWTAGLARWLEDFLHVTQQNSGESLCYTLGISRGAQGDAQLEQHRAA